MKIIPAATIVVLTPEERQVLEALAGSRKAEARMRDRARIVLLASAGTASRAIARDVGCTPGTASKWRVRYANKRMAGLGETGDRGNEPKYGPEHGQRILALLDKPTAGWVLQLDGPVVGTRTGRHPRAVYLAIPARAEDRPVRPQILVSKHGPRLCIEGR